MILEFSIIQKWSWAIPREVNNCGFHRGLYVLKVQVKGGEDSVAQKTARAVWFSELHGVPEFQFRLPSQKGKLPESGGRLQDTLVGNRIPSGPRLQSTLENRAHSVDIHPSSCINAQQSSK